MRGTRRRTRGVVLYLRCSGCQGRIMQMVELGEYVGNWVPLQTFHEANEEECRRVKGIPLEPKREKTWDEVFSDGFLKVPGGYVRI